MSEAGRISLTIGTAGHVDHGKTTLVGYMTGTDTDRLEEEHRRGISIVPGYAELELPSGLRASLIDVPGHERFVKNMVAGSTGVDAFLLVVAADDGVMPQTREHLDVLRVLGVERGLVALTKIDVVDEETAELATLDAEELLESVGLEAGIFPVSGVTGAGVEDLLLALDDLASRPWRERSGGSLARLPVDRVFVLRGIGVVVTGTLWNGEVRPSDTLYTANGLSPRVRGVQNHGHPASVAFAGARTALDLAGIEASDIEAGDVLLSRPVPPTRYLDARVRVLESARPLRHGVLVRLHHGARDVNARLRLRETAEIPPGSDALARLRLDEPLVMLPGDRFVLRSLTPRITVGGGTVLDPDPQDRAPDPRWLEALESRDAAKVIPLAVSREPLNGMTTDALALVTALDSDEVRGVAASAPGIVEVGGIFVEEKTAKAAGDRLVSSLERRAKERPEDPALSVAEARTATGLGPELADALIAEMESRGVRVGDSGVRLADADEVPPELEAEAAETLAGLREAGAEPPNTEPSQAVRLLVGRGEVVALGGKLFAAKEAAEDVLEVIKEACRRDGEISLADLRDRLRTSRKFAQAWLEYADSERVTARTGDVRVLTRRHR